MKRYDFDKVIERRGTNATKYNYKGMGKPESAIPLWVADMDFMACDPVLEALRKAVDHGIFGYSSPGEDYYEAAAGWFERRFSWRPEKEWLVYTPGVVFALSAAVRAFTEPGGNVLIQPPVYYPFSNAIRNNGRRIVENPLILRDGRYEIDFDDMERKIAENGVRLFILCSPHNPVGRIWSADELRRMGEISGRYGTVIVADEIHCDFHWPGREYRLVLEACPEFADRVMSCTAPSKTFNLAGMQTSNIWIPDAELRRRFADEVHSRGFFSPGILGAEACRAAYEGGEEWFDQCLEYLHGNYEFIRDYLAARIPEIKPVEPDGTYFLWLDFSALGMERAELDDFVLNKAGLWVDEGHIFGTGGEGFQRIILACPRSMLVRAMEQLEEAVKALR